MPLREDIFSSFKFTKHFNIDCIVGHKENLIKAGKKRILQITFTNPIKLAFNNKIK